MSSPQKNVSPELSIIVASAFGADKLKRCLMVLVPQLRLHSPAVEVVVADASGCPAEEISEILPNLLLESFPLYTPLPVLWGAGIRRSTGAAIAIIDSATLPGEAWVENLLRVGRNGPPILGGAVEMNPPNTLTDWAAYFSEYAQFMRPLPEGEVEELPGNNVCFKRSLLEVGNQYTQPEFWKTYWCRELQKAGIPLRLNESLIVHNAKSYSLLPFLLRRFRHGRCFAGMRLAQVSGFKRWLLGIGSFALPVLLLMRIIKKVWPKKRYRKEFLSAFPVTLLAVTGWSAGEFVGYFLGEGNSCRYIY